MHEAFENTAVEHPGETFIECLAEGFSNVVNRIKNLLLVLHHQERHRNGLFKREVPRWAVRLRSLVFLLLLVVDGLFYTTQPFQLLANLDLEFRVVEAGAV